MSSVRPVAVALLLALAGCSGLAADTTTTTSEPTTVSTTAPTATPTTELTTESTTDATTADTTEPHTAHGTSHTATHFVLSDNTHTGNVSYTLVGADNETYALDGGRVDLTRTIHERDHDVRVVVERGNETVFDRVVRGYEYYSVSVDDNETSVQHSEV